MLQKSKRDNVKDAIQKTLCLCTRSDAFQIAVGRLSSDLYL